MAGLDRGHTHSTMQPKVATYLAIWAEHCGTAGADRSSPFRCAGAITGLRVPVCGGGAWKKRREPARPPGRAGFGAVAPTNESHAASRRIGRSFRGARTWPPRGASRRSGASGGGRPYHWIRAARPGGPVRAEGRFVRTEPSPLLVMERLPSSLSVPAGQLGGVSSNRP
jgi:hypothetical protein